MAFTPKFRGVNHISVMVRDMDKSLTFYRDMVGLKVKADLPVTEKPRPPKQYRQQHQRRRTVVLGTGGGPDIALIGHPGSKLLGTGILLDDVGITHFALEVENLKGFTEHMRKQGAEETGPGFFMDPDGILVQFEEPGEAARILEGHRQRSEAEAKAKAKPAAAKAKPSVKTRSRR